MFTAAYDEAYALPTEESAILALRTQQILADETGLLIRSIPGWVLLCRGAYRQNGSRHPRDDG